MEKRKLGQTGIEIAPLVLGGNVFGWTADEKNSFEVLDEFVDQGFNCVDTADVYSVWAPEHKGGESESIIGKWFKQSGKRDKVIIATKCGMELSPDKKGLSKKYIKEACDASLKRLKTDYIDLYQSHIDDESTPLEETLEAFGELIKSGKVRAIGASNYKADRLAKALEVAEKQKLPAYQTLQPLYNLYDRKAYEAELEDVCKKHKLGVITYFSLAAGFLTGKYKSESDVEKNQARGAKVKTYLNPRGLKVVGALEKVAHEIVATPAQVSLAWLMMQPTVTAPIVSATNLQQLDDILECINVELDTKSLKMLNDASNWR